ncbi:extracellular solute-binding protein [Paenibacillus oralis]|uniref:Extracellular solute-binding protein n=1 Tax=Paenibacillus oralis TaxID=2490856 RepID=A0A3P3U1F3_9BACL|nr:extracellular solute-binding protein [Paenibacillus oralis]RRJ64175.1 extracellular solute-binding protein [Paenibacillus oralis]
MSKQRMKAASLAAVLLLAAGLTACGGGSGKAADNKSAGPSAEGGSKTQMVMYDWQTSDTAMTRIGEDLAKEFNALPDSAAQIEIQHVPGDPYYPKINAGLAANNGPDVFSLHAAGKMKTYVDAGRLLPLDDAFAADPEWKERFTSGAFNLLTFDGKIYGIPTSFSTAVLFYNKDIFEEYGLEAPTTYVELKQVIQVLRDNKVTPFAFGAKEAWTSALFSELVANRIGGDEPFNAIMNGGGTWEDPSYIETGRIMQELAKMGAFPEGFLGIDNNGMVNLFKNGGAAMLVTGSWAINQLTADDSKVKDAVDIAKFPTFSGGKGDLDTWLGQPSFNLVINAKAKDTDAAIQFLKTWSEDKYQKRIAEEGGDIAATNVQLDPEKVPELSRKLSNQMSAMKGMFIFYDQGLGAQIGDEYNNTIQAILAGQAPEEAFKELQAYTERYRAENK